MGKLVTNDTVNDFPLWMIHAKRIEITFHR